MSNRIKLKRNSASDYDSTTSFPSGLHYGEVAFQNYYKRLYIGKLDSNTTDSNAATVHLPLLSDLTYGDGISGTIASGVTDNSATIALDIGNINTAITSGLHNSQDHFALSDNGSLKKITFGNLKNAIYAGVTGGDVVIASGGAATIQADSVEGTMLNTNVADTSTIELSSDTLSVLKVPNALTAGTGITAAGTFDGAAARTISITPGQTAITSVMNANLKVGSAADDHHMDFSTDNEIRLGSNSVVFLKIKDDTQNEVIIGDGTADVDFVVDNTSGSNAFKVQASDGAVTIAGALTAGSFSTTNLFGTNVIGNVYKFNNGGSAGNTAFTIASSGSVTFAKALGLDHNLTIKPSAGLSGSILNLQTAQVDVASNDIIGSINFSAPDSTATGDARLLAASIEAVGAATFSSTSNATKLRFKVGNSETASTAMTIDNNKKVTIEGDLQVNGTTTTIESTVVKIDDPIFTLGGASTAGLDDGKDRGIEFKWNSGGAKTGFFGMDDTDNTFMYIADASESSETYTGTLGNAKFGSVAASAVTGATINCGTY
jgi:hypothetical protein